MMEKDYKLKITLPVGHEMSNLELEKILYHALYERLIEDGLTNEVLRDWKKFNVDILMH